MSSEHPDVVERMRERILDWLEEGRAVQPAAVPMAEETLKQLRER